MYDPDIHSVRSGNLFTLTLATPVPEGSKEPSDYNSLYNKPRINGVELSGNISLEAIGIQPAGDYASEPLTSSDIDDIINSLD